MLERKEKKRKKDPGANLHVPVTLAVVEILPFDMPVPETSMCWIVGLEGDLTYLT